MTRLHYAVGLFGRVMEYRWRPMEDAPDAVACVILHDTAAVSFGDRLNHTAYFGIGHTRPANRDRSVQTLAAVSLAAYRAVRISFIRSALARAFSPTGYVAFLV